jgi:hypothetical protein
MKPQQPADRQERPNGKPRKAYAKPQLERYGDLTEISKAVGSGTMNDGAAHPNKHFTN